MYAVIEMIKHREDNTGDPEVDWGTETEVHLFTNQAAAEAWVYAEREAFPAHPAEERGDLTRSYFLMVPLDHTVPGHEKEGVRPIQH